MITGGSAGTLDGIIAGLLADPGVVPAHLAGQPWWRQSLARGALGIAVLHVERAAAGEGPWERARDWLDTATREPVTAGAGSHLFHGTPALAYVLSRAAAAGRTGGQRTLSMLKEAISREAAARTARAHARMDLALLPELAEFDLIRGLTGFGACLLGEDPAGPALRSILQYLVRLSEPAILNDTTVPGWWTLASPSGQRSAAFTAGHANLGVAHGIGGPLALLALATRNGATVAGQLTAITRICAWLSSWHTNDPAQPAWPFWITWPGHQNRQRAPCWPQRLGWCYGTAGLARAVQLAAITTGDPALQSMAETTLITALEAPANQAATRGLSLCHGLAGLARIASAAATDASGTPAGHLRVLADSLIDAIQPDGYNPAAVAAKLVRDPAGPGFLDGAAGVALTTLTTRTHISHGWDTCLLVR
jgi:lantibiotic biosynthesis protein